MRLPTKSWLWGLFGLQGLAQVLYWEVIKGYPVCLMCQGYRWLYLAIALSALAYGYAPSFARLRLMIGVTGVEALWAVWDVLQKVGHVGGKCQSVGDMILGGMVLGSCTSSPRSLSDVLVTPTGLNALLSLGMTCYGVGVLWRLRRMRAGSRRALGVLLIGGMGVGMAQGTVGVDPQLQSALKAQEAKAKTYEAELKEMLDTPALKAKLKDAEAEVKALRIEPTLEGIAAAKAVIDPQSTWDCRGKCPSFQPVREDVSFKVCMSFSVPDAVWRDLSPQLVRHGGVFVLEGLPENSFQAFAAKVVALRKQGVVAPIQLDPKVFETYDITQVPTFVVKDGAGTHTVAGTVTVAYVHGLVQAQKGGAQ